jgi:mycothiol synthase
VTTPSTLSWEPLTEDDLGDLRRLAAGCLEADGGLPLLSGEMMLRRLFLSGAGIGGRDSSGALLAATSVAGDGSAEHTATGLVHPAVRHRGHGRELMAWCAQRCGGSLPRVAVETTSPDTDRMLTAEGLRRTFAEHVMRHPLVDVPTVARPAGLRVAPWTDETATLFHTAYRLAFADRPGFPDTSRDEWVGDVGDEPGFRPEASRVAMDARGEPAGFVTLTDDWVDQVGVVPAWRGRSLGAHLVARSLRALKEAGCEQVWLTVNVDNAAHDLYLRLGFVDVGLRARYTRS